MLDFQRLIGLNNRCAEHGDSQMHDQSLGFQISPPVQPYAGGLTNRQGEGVSSTPLHQRLLLKPALDKFKELNSTALPTSGLNRRCYNHCTV